MMTRKHVWGAICSRVRCRRERAVHGWGWLGRRAECQCVLLLRALAIGVVTGGALSMTTGCGTKGLPDVVPVSGIVLREGQPLVGAKVMFLTSGGSLAAGEFSYGTTDQQGRFSLLTQIGGQTTLRGAVPGHHRVIISKFVPPPGMTEEAYQQKLAAEKQAMESRGFVTPEEMTPPTVELLPVKFSHPEQSTLSAVVEKRGKNDLRFELP